MPLALVLGCGAAPVTEPAEPSDDATSEQEDMIDVDEELDERSVDGTVTDVDEEVRLSDKPAARHDDASGAEAVTPGVMKHTNQQKKKPADEDEEEDDERKPPPKKKP